MGTATDYSGETHVGLQGLDMSCLINVLPLYRVPPHLEERPRQKRCPSHSGVRSATRDMKKIILTKPPPAAGGSAMEKDYLILKRASASRPSGEWSDDDYDVLADSVVVGRIFKAKRRAGRGTASRRSHANARLCRDARGSHGRVREKLAAQLK